MRKQWRVLAVTLAVLGVVGVAAFVLELHRGNFVHVTAAELRKKIAHDLPSGTPFPVVQDWAKATFPQTGFRGVDGVVWALYPDAESNGFVRTELYVEFHFDINDRLISSTVTERYVGP